MMIEKERIKMTEKVLFKGKEEYTRGDLGDLIVSGRLQDGYVFVWETDYGWRLYAAFDPELWERTGVMTDPVPEEA